MTEPKCFTGSSFWATGISLFRSRSQLFSFFPAANKSERQMKIFSTRDYLRIGANKMICQSILFFNFFLSKSIFCQHALCPTTHLLTCNTHPSSSHHRLSRTTSLRSHRSPPQRLSLSALSLSYSSPSSSLPPPRRGRLHRQYSLLRHTIHVTNSSHSPTICF